jgi:hypothetical protein
VDAGDSVLVVVDLDVLLELAILVPLFNLDNILSLLSVISHHGEKKQALESRIRL